MNKSTFKFDLRTVITVAVLLASLGLVNPALAAHGDSGHTGGHSGGGIHSGGHDTDHDTEHEDGADAHSGHTGGPKRHGSYGGHGHSHDVARDVGRTVENRIFRGGRPVWAQEGIPEVELGRLNVGRAPGFVLARAEDKALEEFKATMAALYNLSADEAASLLSTQYGDTERIHSPVQNLALYRDVMVFGKTQLPDVAPATRYDLAAIFLGSASDKNIPITDDTIIAINRILGLVEMEAGDISVLAAKAETVRTAILTGHDSSTHTESIPH
jgi:hypothetical protein